ncbi:MAG TPA: GTPase HflX [Acidobacteriota bacterium]|nr:GTPase HflX [Acidobacteriota bacterium]
MKRGERAIRHEIHGNLKGIKASERRALERTYRRHVPSHQVVSPELARHLTSISHQLGRQVGVLLTRDGDVQNVIVGDASQLEIPEIGRLRGGVGRFRGLRLVHTHLKGEDLTADDLNDLCLLRLDLVAMVEVLEDGDAGRIELAHILPGQDDEEDPGDPFRRISAKSVFDLDFYFEAEILALEDEFSKFAGKAGKTKKERVLIVALSPKDELVQETIELVRSANVTIAGLLRQKRRHPHAKTGVGAGKLREIVLEGMRRRADVAIFDCDLSPAQARAFEDATGMKCVDRTQLILDIFAQRARSRDGKLQVELAQLKYDLPRLTEKDEGLSRLTGGIGGRGPGETVMEIGRRRIRDRIRRLEKKIDQLSKQRDLRRSRRRKEGLPVLSIIGYTNAGKSTLLNALTDSEIAAEDRLFMTLDPTSRRLRFPREKEVIITDTVGFIRDLPEDLVAAFRATLEELAEADLLLHVVDAADENLEDKYSAVQSLVNDLDLRDVPILTVVNKCDLVDEERAQALARRYNGVAVSATQREGLRQLLETAEERVGQDIAPETPPPVLDPAHQS